MAIQLDRNVERVGVEMRHAHAELWSFSTRRRRQRLGGPNHLRRCFGSAIHRRSNLALVAAQTAVDNVDKLACRNPAPEALNLRHDRMSRLGSIRSCVTTYLIQIRSTHQMRT